MSSQQSSRGSAYSSTASSPYQHAYYYDAPAQATWMKVIPIEDDELTFGGKPLSDWHEEDLRRYSSSSFDSHDEHRGRTRQRASYYEPTSAPGSGSGPTSSGGHHHKHGHGHKHHHKKSDKKK
ncbi:hypothetical protein INS49_004649 [Diaporthe citri]|uniref:uncharacterized protein n=1 Tax=Diaporthe citri TaxID=83186 RepID=UPI001C7F5DBD|nr:uncharacterized protein INS49_004649 [Diaporthe citri]KAG6354631.1 hypothetical protein INS49_004649 [Diaporthe citri]